MSGNARNCSTWSSGRQTPRSSYCAQLPVAEATISPSPVRSHAQPRAAKYCSRTSMGAPSSRSSWVSSSLRFTPPGSSSACRRRAWRRVPAGPATLASRAAIRAFRISFSSRAAAAMAFTASNSSRPTKSWPPIHSRIFSRALNFGFTPHAGHRSGKAVHHLHEVVEHLVLGLHRNSSSFRAEIGICGSVRHPASRDYPQLPEISPDYRGSYPNSDTPAPGLSPSIVELSVAAKISQAR